MGRVGKRKETFIVYAACSGVLLAVCLQGAIASQAGTQDGVFKQLASEDIHAVLELFRVVR